MRKGEMFGKGNSALIRENPSFHLQHLSNTSLTATSSCTGSNPTNGFNKLHLTSHPD